MSHVNERLEGVPLPESDRVPPSISGADDKVHSKRGGRTSGYRDVDARHVGRILAIRLDRRTHARECEMLPPVIHLWGPVAVEDAVARRRMQSTGANMSGRKPARTEERARGIDYDPVTILSRCDSSVEVTRRFSCPWWFFS